ncbi:glucose-1-phosphate adenylyltransferase family protein [bacterium]
MIQDVLALVFAGARTHTLSILEQKRTNASIPFGGNHRLIDFSLSNIANSGITRVGVLTQYKPLSLIEHINFGKPWDLVGRSREVRVLPPYTLESRASWYQGTADAIYRNIDFIQADVHEHVLFMSGEDVYKFDFDELYDFHHSKNADIAIVGKYMEPDTALSRFGIINIDSDGKVLAFNEKPKKPKSNLIYISIALFKKDILLDEIRLDAKDSNSSHNFSADILPNLIKKYKVYTYINKNPWHYIGNIDEYWNTNIQMLKKNTQIDPEKWGIRTNIDDRNSCYRIPAIIKNSANIKNSIISKGCIINGAVKNSVIFPGVRVEKTAKIVDSIVMHDCYISQNCNINKSILDKDVYLEKNVTIGTGPNTKNKEFPHDYYSGISVIGKSVVIPKNLVIGKNCLIFDTANLEKLKNKNIPSGSCIK